MPSSRECYGLVFAEAGAFGLPVLAIDTGGVSTIVKNGYNGWLFQQQDPIECYGNRIRQCLADKTYYETICHQARANFEQRLNWTVAGKRISQLMAQL